MTGKRRQVTRTVHVSGERRAYAELAKLTAEVGRHGPGTNAMTVGELMDQWLAHQAVGVSKNTAETWRHFTDRYIAPRIGNVPLAKLTVFDLDRLYRDLSVNGGMQGQPLAPATVHKVHSILRLALDRAVRWGLLPANPTLSAKPPAVPRGEPVVPSTDDCRRLLEAAEQQDPEWALFIRIAAVLGARRGELCALRWSDLDLNAGTVTIKRVIMEVKGGAVERDYPKNRSSVRRVALDDATIVLLAAQARYQERRAAVADVELAPDCFLFSAALDGSRPWSPNNVTNRFGRLRDRLGLPGVTIHKLRHYMATQWIAGGEDVRTVASRGGWANPSVLLSTYAHFVPSKDRDGAAKYGSQLD